MKTLRILQGSPEWHAHRATARNASDAPAMMGASPYVTRSELIRHSATGVQRDIDPATQAIFDRGHALEHVLRAIGEKMHGEDFFPVVASSDDGYLSASFDGVTMAEDYLLEAKQANASKIADIRADIIPKADYWQIVQQFAVCETAIGMLYICGDGTDKNTAVLIICRKRVEDDIPKLRAGWAQFDADVAAYAPEPEVLPPAVGQAPDSLPALRIELQGMVTASNLDTFKSHAMAVLGGINRELVTDQDFADAEQTVKWAKSVEDKLDAAKAHALSQTADIDALFRTIDDVSAETRRIRLELDKLVKAEKERRKADIVAGFVSSVQAHYAGISGGLPEAYAPCVQFPQAITRAAMAEAVKGKRTLDSMTSACDSAAASLKIEASQQADRIRACIAVLEHHKDHAELFADRVQLCATKQPEDLENLVAARIAEHEKQEAERVARIEREALEKARREVEAKAHAESIKKAAELQKSEQKQTADEVIDAIVTYDLITLDDVNNRLAPILITEIAFSRLGYNSSISETQFQELCVKLHNIISTAQE